MYDYCVVGAGIVGLSTAYALLAAEPDSKVLVLDKEQAVACHQTGHNSGVIHAGIYYAPGSRKAQLCREGMIATRAFCEEHGVPYRNIGKLVVATNEQEHARLLKLEENARANDVHVQLLSGAALREMEPAISGVAALHVKDSSIVDYRQISQKLAELITSQGARILYGEAVDRIVESYAAVEVHTDSGTHSARNVVVCAGLQADRIARRSGLNLNFRIVPFRGDYYGLADRHADLVCRMIYPVPDPALPFLGVHITPAMDGSIHVGPNAVLSLVREHYRRGGANLADMWDTLSYPGFWKVALANLSSGLQEFADATFKSRYVQRCQKYCESICEDDIEYLGSGVRAQAVSQDGRLLHDFEFIQTRRCLHVGNAPSPAATASIPIGQYIRKSIATQG